MKTVLWDMEQTLVDTSKPIQGALKAIAEDLGVDMPMEELVKRALEYNLLEIFGITKQNLWHRLAYHYSPENGRCLGEINIYPDTHSSLERVRSRSIQQGVISDSPKKRVEMFSDRFDLKKYFASAQGNSEEREDKPDPQVSLDALEEIGDPKGRIYVIGDSPVDIGCGINLREATGKDVKTVLIQRNGHFLKQKPDYIARSLTEAVDYIINE